MQKMPGAAAFHCADGMPQGRRNSRWRRVCQPVIELFGRKKNELSFFHGGGTTR
jgi:hypothetical protein